MRRLLLPVVALVCLVCLVAPPARAQDHDALRFRTLSLEDGLSQSSVQAILQDSQGFIWLGTEDGLNRYDGHAFVTYYPNAGEPRALVNNNVLALAEDDHRQLWIGTSGGLDRLDSARQTFTHYLPGTTVTTVVVADGGVVWVGTALSGLYRYHADDDRFGRIDTIPGVSALAVDDDGRLWVGTASGLAQVPPGGDRLQPDPVPWANLGAAAVQALAPHGRALWVGTERGLLHLDLDRRTVTRLRHDPNQPDSLPSDNVHALLRHDEELWVGTRQGLARYRKADGTFSAYQKSLRRPDSLGENWVAALYRDRGGVLWVGTVGGGVSLYSPSTQKFRLVQADGGQADGGLSSNFVVGLCRDAAGDLWVGTLGGGLNRRDAATGRFTALRHVAADPASLSSDNVFSVTCHDDALWLGTLGGGLVHVDPATLALTTYRYDPDDPFSLPEDDVAAVLPNGDGTLWVGTWNRGLALLEGDFGRFTPIPMPDGPQRIWALAQDDAGRLWIGTWNGLWLWDRPRDAWRAYRHDPDDPASLSNNIVSDLLPLPDGSVWVATADGLNRLDATGDRFTRYTTADGLPNNTIYAMLPDAAGRLWLSTNRGLSHFDPVGGRSRNYDVSDGLQSNEFNRGAAYRAPDGELYFGGINGYNHFYPDQITDNPHAPPVVITAFRRFGEISATNLPDGATLELSHRDNFITFEFAALDFAAPAQNQFAYQMVGFDPDWIVSGTQHARSYTNLEPGTYTFRVRAGNNDGVWNETGTAVTLVITPPFWQTLWFRTTAILATFALLFSGFRWRVQRIERQNQRLAAEVGQRTAELAALLQTGQTLSATLALEPLLALILAQLRDVVGFEAASIAVLDGAVLQQVEYVGPAPRAAALALRVPVAELGIIWPRLAAGAVVAIGDISADTPEAAAYRRLAPPAAADPVTGAHAHLRAWLGVPLRQKETTTGILALRHRQPGYFTPERTRLARAFADQAAIAMENARLYEQAQTLAALEERQKLARELHDSVSQALYGIALGTRTARSLLDTLPDASRTRLDPPLAYVLQLADAGLTEMRALIFELRPESLEKEGLVAALEKQTASLRARHQLSLTTRFDDEPAVALGVKEALYRVAQEALNNVVKHAGATHVAVTLQTVDDRLVLTIRDDGCGFDPAGRFPGHLGLTSMRERSERAGGALHIDSAPGQGTTVTATVPVPGKQEKTSGG